MAVEELGDLPPYSEMIVASISALDEKGGSSKAAISKYMESTYVGLPTSHPSLLGAHLTRMKDAGELTMVKSNYLLPSPDETPAKRGRGRPPKPKSEGSEGETPSSAKRSRGRPPKDKDPIAAAVAKVAGGFVPSKKEPAAKKARPETPTAATPSPGGSAKRGRGRPPKVKTPVADVEA